MIASLKVKHFLERPTCSETFEKSFPLKAGFKFKAKILNAGIH